jgi:hypothetical protein
VTASHPETVRHCEDCAAPRLFVAVCLDGHTEGCLDLVCAACGAGYALVPPAIPARAPDALRHVA